MNDTFDINSFLENELNKILASLNNESYFTRLKNEEESFYKKVEAQKRLANNKTQQEERRLNQLHSVKIKDVNDLINELDKTLELYKKQGLSPEKAQKVEDNLKLLVEKLEAEMNYEINQLKVKINGQLDNNLKIEKEKFDRIAKIRIAELNKIIEESTERIKILNDYYETAPLDVPVWKKVEKEITRLIETEKEEKKNTKKKRKKKKEQNLVLSPRLNYILLSEKKRDYTFFENNITFNIPIVESFYAKNSISIKHHKNQKVIIKQIVDQIVTRSLVAAETGNILFYFCDPFGNGSLFFDFLDLPNEIYNKQIYTSTAEVDRVITEILKLESKIVQTHLKSYSIEEYNKLFPKSTIPYRFIIFDNFPKGVSPNAIQQIEKLARTAIKAGIHFVFLVEEMDDKNVQNILTLTKQHSIGKDIYNYNEDLSLKIKKQVVELTNRKYNAVKSIYFEDYFDDDFAYWQKESSKELSIRLGLKGKDFYNLTFAGEKAHCVITGTTGSGKSCFLHALITNACLNYSPDELKLFLIDLKTGVEFQKYASLELPHAEFIALRSSPDYGLHILKVVQTMIKERGDYFTREDIGAKDLETFKAKFPDKPMPRYLIIIDEYHELFTSSYETKEAAYSLFAHIAKQGRSFGFNLILASQTVVLNAEALMNFGLKIIMKVGHATIARELLGSNVPFEIAGQAENLKPGQVFIPNEDNADKIQSFFLTDDAHLMYLKQIKQKWEEKTKGTYHHKPIVFNRETGAFIENNKTIFDLKPQKNIKKLLFSPGEKLMVDGKDFIGKLNRERNENILVMGGKLDVSLRGIHGTFVSLLPQLDKKQTKITVFNYIDKSEKELYSNIKSDFRIIQKFFKKLNYHETTEEDDVLTLLKNINVEVENRMKKTKQTVNFQTEILVFYNIDKNEIFHEVVKQTQMSLEPTECKSESTEILMNILNNGPSVGIHSLIHASEPESYYKVFDATAKDHEIFNHRVFAQMTIDNSTDFIHYSCQEAAFLVEPELGEAGFNRILYFNASLNIFKKLPVLKPYEFISDDNLNLLLTTKK